MTRFLISFIISTLVVCLACSSPSSQSEIHQECDLYANESISIHEQFFNHVKSNPYCQQYNYLIDSEDEYGKTIWKKFYICTDFTKEEYEEMRKYETWQAYDINVPGRIKNERGNLADKYNFEKPDEIK